MLSLSETIVYVWILPVATQIILPLAMFVVWGISRVVVLSRPVKRRQEKPAGEETEELNEAIAAK